MESRKERLHRLESELSKSSNLETDQARELVGLLLEDAKDALVSSVGEETLRLQGEAKAFKRLVDKLARAAPPPAPSRPVMHAGVDLS